MANPMANVMAWEGGWKRQNKTNEKRTKDNNGTHGGKSFFFLGPFLFLFQLFFFASHINQCATKHKHTLFLLRI